MTKLKTKVIFIDESGNVYLENRDFERSGFGLGDSLTVTIGELILDEIPFHSGLYCKMFGTVLIRRDDAVFLAIRNGNAKEKYNLSKGQSVYVDLCIPGGYWEKENAYSFTEISDQKLYDSVESFANFRPLFHGTNHFYRSSSPVDDAYCRAESVRQCVKKYGIKTIIDMADTIEEYNNLSLLLNGSGVKILQKCKVYPIGDDSGLYSIKFEQSVLAVMRIILEAEMPCMIHCRAGKRRSGFICAILQSLHGVSDKEIMSDYMVSYKNNNGITYNDNPSRYEYLKNDTIKKILYHINGVDLNDLVKTTKKYLKRIGMSNGEIEKLIAKLR